MSTRLRQAVEALIQFVDRYPAVRGDASFNLRTANQEDDRSYHQEMLRLSLAVKAAAHKAGVIDLLPKQRTTFKAAVEHFGVTNLPGVWERPATNGPTLTRWGPPARLEEWKDELRAMCDAVEPKKRGPGGRTPNHEKSSDDHVLTALCLWHGFDNGSVNNEKPATGPALARLVKPKPHEKGKKQLQDNALFRFLNHPGKKRGGFTAYRAACRSGRIGSKLAQWRAEFVPPRRKVAGRAAD